MGSLDRFRGEDHGVGAEIEHRTVVQIDDVKKGSASESSGRGAEPVFPPAGA